jgi:hypothetical protein
MDLLHTYRAYLCNLQSYYINAIKGIFAKDVTITGTLISPLTTDLDDRLTIAESDIISLETTVSGHTTDITTLQTKTQYQAASSNTTTFTGTVVGSSEVKVGSLNVYPLTSVVVTLSNPSSITVPSWVTKITITSPQAVLGPGASRPLLVMGKLTGAVYPWTNSFYTVGVTKTASAMSFAGSGGSFFLLDASVTVTNMYMNIVVQLSKTAGNQQYWTVAGTVGYRELFMTTIAGYMIGPANEALDTIDVQNLVPGSGTICALFE